MRALIDTCVIIDALQNREPFAADAQDIFLVAANCAIEAFITAKSVSDIYYITHRSTHSDEMTRQILAKLFLLFPVLDTDGEDCRQALASPMGDYEDAIMVETAKRVGMDCIVTRNTKDYTHSTVPVFTPEAFLQIVNASS